MSIFRTQITEEGKLDFGSDFNLMRWREFCKEHPGAHIRIVYEPPTRSISQHKYYWAYLTVISRETGNTEKALHARAKSEFLPPEYATVFGKEVTIEGSTKELSKSEFSDFLDKISAATGVPLLDPSAAGYVTG